MAVLCWGWGMRRWILAIAFVAIYLSRDTRTVKPADELRGISPPTTTPTRTFCNSCRYEADQYATCGERLATLTAVNGEAGRAQAIEHIQSFGFRHCSFANVTLRPLVTDLETNRAKRCLERRGLSGRWVQDEAYGLRNAYPNHRRYTECTWHHAYHNRVVQQKQNGHDHPLPSYLTYKWVDDECPLTEITLAGFCRVLHALHITRILILGDSLSFQFRKSLEAMLGFPFWSLSENRDWLDFDESSLPCHEVGEGMEAIKMQLLSLKPVRESVALHPGKNKSYLEDVFRKSAPRLREDPVQLTQTMASFYRKVGQRAQFVESNPNQTLLVANVGAWMKDFDEYRESLEAVFAWIDTLPRERIVPFFRDTVPGHPECQPSGPPGVTIESFNWTLYPASISPYADYDEREHDMMQKRSRPSAEDWPIYWKDQSNGTFERYNAWTKELIRKRPPDVAKIRWLNVYNSSALRRDGLIGFGDCLHHNLPGPRDHEVHLLHSALLDLASVDVHKS